MQIDLVWLIVSAAVALAVGILAGVLVRKSIGEKKIGSAEVEAKRILEDSKKNAEAKKKELLLEAKEEGLRLRNETERDLKERRSEVSRQERRITQKEENLDKKTEALERKNEQLDEKIKANEALQGEINEVLKQHMARLEEIVHLLGVLIGCSQAILHASHVGTTHETADDVTLGAHNHDGGEARNLVLLAQSLILSVKLSAHAVYIARYVNLNEKEIALGKSFKLRGVKHILLQLNAVATPVGTGEVYQHGFTLSSCLGSGCVEVHCPFYCGECRCHSGSQPGHVQNILEHAAHYAHLSRYGKR